MRRRAWRPLRHCLMDFGESCSQDLIELLLSSQSWPMPLMLEGVINCANLFLSHRFSQIQSFDQ